MAFNRRVPGGVVPRAPAREERRRGLPRLDGKSGAPFDPAERPLGMIPETWAPKEDPVMLSAEKAPPGSEESRERLGPSLTVWIILITFIVLVVLAVISYRNAPP